MDWLSSRGISLILGAGLALTACAKGGETAHPPQDTATPTPKAEATLEVLELGAEPRTLLRYTIEAGTTSRSRVSTDLQVSTQVQGQGSQTIDVPPYAITTASEVLEVQGDGSMRVSTVVEGTEVAIPKGSDPTYITLASSLKQEFEGLSGLRTESVISPRGTLVSTEIDQAGEVDPALLATLDNVHKSVHQGLAPLPEEAVGPGAHWRQFSTTYADNIPLATRSDYRLIAMEGDTAIIEIVIEMEAGEQEMPKDESINEDIKMMLRGMTGKTTGEIHLNPKSLTNASTMISDILIRTAGEMMGQTFETSVTTQMIVQVEKAGE